MTLIKGAIHGLIAALRGALGTDLLATSIKLCAKTRTTLTER